MIGTGIAVDVLTDMLSSGDCFLRYTDPWANDLSCQHPHNYALASKDEDNAETRYRCLSMPKSLHDYCCLYPVFRSSSERFIS